MAVAPVCVESGSSEMAPFSSSRTKGKTSWPFLWACTVEVAGDKSTFLACS